MVCSLGRTAIHARRGDFFRSDEPVAEQLAAIPRAASNRDRLNAARVRARVRPCNHTFVADSFEKRDDFCIAMKRTRSLRSECLRRIECPGWK
jgi:hypothetical protein